MGLGRALTSELVLLFLYSAVLAVKSAFKTREQGDRIAAILTLVGLVDLPVIHYSVYWWNSLHQKASLTLFARPAIAAPMLYPLLLTLLGFSLYSLWIMLHKACSEVLERERKQFWVKDLLERGKL